MLIEQATDIFGDVECVAVKKGYGDASLGYHPEVSCEKIRAGVSVALREMHRFKPYKLRAPFTMSLKVRNEKEPYPGVQKVRDGEFTFTTNDIMEVINAFYKMR